MQNALSESLCARFWVATVEVMPLIARVNERIVTVIGELKMPLMKLPRRMTVVRSKSGELVIFSAIALREPDMAELEALGRPAFLIVLSERRRLDAPGYLQR